MKFKSTLFLFIILIGLSLYAYFYETKGREERKSEEERQKRVLKFDKEKLDTISIVRENETMAVKRISNDDWMLEAPYKAEVDRSVMQSIVSNLETIAYTSTVDDATDLKVFGLDKPKLTVTLIMQDGEKQIIRLGNEVPIDYLMYIQKEGDKRVLLVTKSFEGNVNKKVKDVREKKIFKVIKEEIKDIKLNVTKTKESMQMIRDGSHWKLKKKDLIAADEQKVQEMVSTIANLYASDFASEKGSENLITFGLDHPQVTVSYKITKDDALSSFILGEKSEKYYLKKTDSNSVFEINKNDFQKFILTEFALRDKKIVKFAKDDIKRIEINLKSGTKIELDKNDKNEWVLPSLKNAKAKNLVIDEFLKSIRDSEIKEFTKDGSNQGDLGRYGLINPVTTVSLLNSVPGKTQAQPFIKIKFGKNNGKLIYAIVENQNSIAALESSVFQKIPKNLSELIEEEKKETVPVSKTIKGDEKPKAK